MNTLRLHRISVGYLAMLKAEQLPRCGVVSPWDDSEPVARRCGWSS